MASSNLYISHNSALHFWRTNPPQYVLDGTFGNIRVLRNCPKSDEEIRSFSLSEAEFGPQPFDVLIPANGPRPRSILAYHVQRAKLPPRSLYPLRDGIFLASPELCFVQLCKTLSLVKAIELGMEICGTYALRPDYPDDKSSRDYQLTSTTSLSRKVNSWNDMHGLARARQASAYIIDRSASPMETKLYLLLCLPQKYGGYNIPKPELNPKFELTLEQRMILRQESIKPDLLWRKQKLAIEYDGEYHNDPIQARRDEKRRVMLETMGFTVETIKKQHVYDPLMFDSFASMVATKLRKRLRPLSLKQQFARENLRDALLASDSGVEANVS